MRVILFLGILIASPVFADVNGAIPPEQLHQKLRQHTIELKKFAAQQNCSTDFVILIDMSLPSSKRRFFVVNTRNDSVVIAGLCGHGQGKDFHNENVVFSNKPNSLCTSEGRYRTGSKYNGAFGTSYKLFGLDPTNDNAYARGIVLHAHSLVPDNEGKHACRSYGCPMVSPKVFGQVSKLLDGSAKPIMVWIYK